MYMLNKNKMFLFCGNNKNILIICIAFILNFIRKLIILLIIYINKDNFIR